MDFFYLLGTIKVAWDTDANGHDIFGKFQDLRIKDVLPTDIEKLIGILKEKEYLVSALVKTPYTEMYEVSNMFGDIVGRFVWYINSREITTHEGDI